MIERFGHQDRVVVTRDEKPFDRLMALSNVEGQVTKHELVTRHFPIKAKPGSLTEEGKTS